MISALKSGYFMASETNLSTVRQSPDHKAAIRPAAGAGVASATRSVPPIAPINATGQTFAQLAQTHQTEKPAKSQTRDRDNAHPSKEPGGNLLSTGAQFLLAETRMQEAHDMFPATSKIAPAHTAYNEVQNRIKLTLRQV